MITRHVMACTIASFAASNVQLRVVSPATAILAFHQHQAITCGGHAMPADVNITYTFVQRNGRRLIVLHTKTPSAN